MKLGSSFSFASNGNSIVFVGSPRFQYFPFSLSFSRLLPLASGLWLLYSCLYDASRLSTRQRDASGILIAIYFCSLGSLVPLVASSRADRYKTDYDTAGGSCRSLDALNYTGCSATNGGEFKRRLLRYRVRRKRRTREWRFGLCLLVISV